MNTPIIDLSQIGEISTTLNEVIMRFSLKKGSDIYMPELSTVNTGSLSGEESQKLTQDIKTAFNDLKSVRLKPLLDLETLNHVTAPVRAIAFQLYEQFGIMPRQNAADMIQQLSTDDRKALRNLGIHMGAFYIYQRDMLRPAAIEMRASLVAAHLEITPQAISDILPKEGNVSLMLRETDIPYQFYRRVGFPVFGKTAVRVDMVERLNSQIYDNAKDGIYRFDPAIASTVGVSVDTVQAMLADLGFQYKAETEKVSQPIKDADGKPTDKTEEVEKEIRLYTLKRRAPKPFRHKKHKADKQQLSNTPSKPLRNDAFSALAALKDKK